MKLHFVVVSSASSVANAIGQTRKFFARAFGAILLTIGFSSAQAAVITFNDVTLSGGNSWSQSGFTLSVAASNGGFIANIGSGQFTGLWLGGTVSSFGTYTFTATQPITSVEVQFDALSNGGGLPVESIGNFSTSSGAPTIGYTNLAGTTFNGSTVLSAAADGRGIINLSAAFFTTFAFDHTQAPSNNGFVIERITVTTVPAPAAVWLFGSGLLGLIGMARRKGD